MKRLAVGVAAGALVIGGLSTQTANAASNADFSPVNSTFTVSPVADTANKATWVVADGVAAYTATLTARDISGALMKNLNTADIVFSFTGSRIVMSSVVNHNDGTYSVTYTSKLAQANSTAMVEYRGKPVGPPPPPACTITPKITELIPALNGVDYSNKPLSTQVVNGVGQVVTYNPVLWSDLGFKANDYSSMPPVQVKGTGQPGTTVTVAGQAAGANCTASVGPDGNWSCTIPLKAFPMTRIQWTASNIKTGILSPSDGYSVWQTFTTTSSCGLASNIQVGSGYITPLAIDFSGTGTIATLSSAQAPGTFGLGPNGEQIRSGWLAPSAGFLVRDLNGNGVVDSIKELFGGGIGDGYAALATYDTNKDGVIDSRDAGYSQLSVWRDLNSNKVTDPGEMLPLSAVVTSISLAHTDVWAVDAAGNAVYERGSVVLTGGVSAAMNDVYFATGIGGALPIPFKAGPADPNPPPCEDPSMHGTNFTVTPTSLKVNERATATALITDKYCNPVSGEPVTFGVTGSATLSLTGPMITDNDGIARATLTDSKAETVNVSARIAAGEIHGSPVAVTFGGGSVSIVKSTFSVSPVPDPYNRATWLTAGGSTPYIATFTAKDDNNNPISGLNLSDIVFATTSSVIRISAVTDNGDGTYTARYTSTAVTWDAQATVTYQGTQVGASFYTLFT